MPKYSFECACGVRFDRNLKMGDHPTHLCPSCRRPAKRRWMGQGFGFGFAAGKTPGNSGVSKQDYPTADQIVGINAEARWAELDARKAVKDKVREVGGTHALIRRQVEDSGKPAIEYEAMSEVGLQARVKRAKEADNFISKHGMPESSLSDLKKALPKGKGKKISESS